MIKLAEIVRKILEEAKHGSGTYTYTFELDNIHIPSMCRLDDQVEVELNINYNYYAGSIGTREDPPKSSEMDISDWDIEDIIIHDKLGNKRGVDLRFLHPMAKKILFEAIEAELEKNHDDIEKQIVSGLGNDDGTDDGDDDFDLGIRNDDRDDN